MYKRYDQSITASLGNMRVKLRKDTVGYLIPTTILETFYLCPWNYRAGKSPTYYTFRCWNPHVLLYVIGLPLGAVIIMHRHRRSSKMRDPEVVFDMGYYLMDILTQNGGGKLLLLTPKV